MLVFEQKRFFISLHGAKEDKEDISRARRDVCECARCSFLPSRRGEDLDRRVVRPHARDAHSTRARVYKKKSSRFKIRILFWKEIAQKMTHRQQQRMSSQAERGTMKKIVFYCPEMEKMAREVRANDPGK